VESAIYDFYGYKVYVEGLQLKRAMDREYWRFRLNENDRPHDDEIGLRIIPPGQTEPREFPTKPQGSKLGIYLPFGEGENIIYYEPKVDLDWVLAYLEMFLDWEDKTILHAGAVSKDKKAFIFCGRGGVGKTSTIINLTRKGFDYLSDDWLIIGNGHAYPFPKTVHIFGYNLADSSISKRVLGLKRLYYKPLFKLLHIVDNISPHRYMSYVAQVLASLMRFDVDIQDLGDDLRVGSMSSISKVYYLERWDGNKILFGDIKAEELARRMAMVTMHERNYFFQEYFQYAAKYGISNKKVENRFKFDLDIFHGSFKVSEIYKVMIPLDMDLSKTENLPFQLEQEIHRS
jgi:hypothetical protein